MLLKSRGQTNPVDGRHDVSTRCSRAACVQLARACQNEVDFGLPFGHSGGIRKPLLGTVLRPVYKIPPPRWTRQARVTGDWLVVE